MMSHRRVSDAVWNEYPGGRQHLSRRRGRVVHHVVEDDVVAKLAAGEVLLGVVDDSIRSQGPNQLEVPGAAHAGDFRTKRLGDLHRERPDASRRPVDQDPGPPSDPAHVTHRDQRGQARHDRCCSLLEGECSGLLDELERRSHSELCERAGPRGEGVGPRRPEHLVTGLEVGHILADSLHDPGDIGSPKRGRRLPEPKAQPEDVGDSSHRDPVRGVHAGGPHPNQRVVVGDPRSVSSRMPPVSG